MIFLIKTQSNSHLTYWRWLLHRVRCVSSSHTDTALLLEQPNRVSSDAVGHEVQQSQTVLMTSGANQGNAVFQRNPDHTQRISDVVSDELKSLRVQLQAMEDAFELQERSLSSNGLAAAQAAAMSNLSSTSASTMGGMMGGGVARADASFSAHTPTPSHASDLDCFPYLKVRVRNTSLKYKGMCLMPSNGDPSAAVVCGEYLSS